MIFIVIKLINFPLLESKYFLFSFRPTFGFIEFLDDSHSDYSGIESQRQF